MRRTKALHNRASGFQFKDESISLREAIFITTVIRIPAKCAAIKLAVIETNAVQMPGIVFACRFPAAYDFACQRDPNDGVTSGGGDDEMFLVPNQVVGVDSSSPSSKCDAASIVNQDFARARRQGVERMRASLPSGPPSRQC